MRVILTNPRYTGRQVWNRQRKDEVLINVHDVALGHTTKMRWNDQDTWIYSEQITNPQIIDPDTFQKAQDILVARRGVRGEHKPHRSKRAYELRGVLYCGLCQRRMQGHWANAAPYHRCRFPSEYALANKLDHPLNGTLRQDALLPPLNEWLASKFEPTHLTATIDELLAATIPLKAQPDDGDDISGKIADCDRRMAQYRAALHAGADPVSVAGWITETEAERARYKAAKQAAAPRRTAKPMSRDQITAIVSDLSGVFSVLRDADPADKSEIYPQLGLHGMRLTYHPGEEPGEGTVQTEVPISPGRHWQFESVRGGT